MDRRLAVYVRLKRNVRIALRCGLGGGAVGAIVTGCAGMLLWNHLVERAAPSARGARIRCLTAGDLFALLVTFGDVKGEINDDADHPWRPGEERIEGIRRNLRVH